MTGRQTAAQVSFALTNQRKFRHPHGKSQAWNGSNLGGGNTSLYTPTGISSGPGAFLFFIRFLKSIMEKSEQSSTPSTLLLSTNKVDLLTIK